MDHSTDLFPVINAMLNFLQLSNEPYKSKERALHSHSHFCLIASLLSCNSIIRQIIIIMIAKIAVFLAVVAVAYGGVAGVVSVAHSPASTVKLPHVVAAPVVTYAAAPVVHTQVAHHAAPIAYAAAPVVHTPVIHAAPVPVAYATAPRVIHTHEPVEQHGYKIAY